MQTQYQLLTTALIFLCGVMFSLFSPASVQAAEYRVVVVQEESQKELSDQPGKYTQTFTATSVKQNESITVQNGDEFAPVSANKLVSAGDRVIIRALDAENSSAGMSGWGYVDPLRTTPLVFLCALFLGLVVAVAQWQGARAFLGMFVTVLILTWGVAPALLGGSNPVVVMLAAIVCMSIATLYLSHGWNIQSHISLGSIGLVLGVVAALSYGSVISLRLTGLGSEEALFLQYMQDGALSLPGLLLAGILLGALGVLDDICVAQVSVVFELLEAKPKIMFGELFERAIRVGKSHVASLVNTLVLAYAGANLPLFLLFLTQDEQPWWVTLNSEIIMEEVVRTLTGSIGLVLAVPITTALAAAVLLAWKARTGELPSQAHAGHGHSHNHAPQKHAPLENSRRKP